MAILWSVEKVIEDMENHSWSISKIGDEYHAHRGGNKEIIFNDVPLFQVDGKFYDDLFYALKRANL